MLFTLKQLSFGALVIEGDCNQPVRSESMGTLDIDGSIPEVARRSGIKDGDIAIDAGAFVGDTAEALAKTGATVYAFEPFLDAFVCMLYNTRSTKVKAINLPTGNGELVKLIYDCPGPNFGMRRVQKSDVGIETFRIDTLGLASCKLMKIDVEGFEIPTLLGAKETILRCRPYLFVEHFVDGQINCGYTPEQMVFTIKSLGYEMEMWGAPPRWDWFCTPK